MEYISKEQLNALYDKDAVTMKGWAMIKQMPTIDIVRCGECKHMIYGFETNVCSVHDCCEVNPTWFCSEGERRTE